jgi:hypothetical protein
MTEDEHKAWRWLLGRGSKTSPIKDSEKRRYKQHIGELDAKAALRRLLRSSGPLSHDIRNLLAGALEERGAGEMQLILIRRAGRGRPKSGVRAAIDESQASAEFYAQKAEGTKIYFADENVARKLNMSRSKAIALRKKRDGKACQEK